MITNIAREFYRLAITEGFNAQPTKPSVSGYWDPIRMAKILRGTAMILAAGSLAFYVVLIAARYAFAEDSQTPHSKAPHYTITN